MAITAENYEKTVKELEEANQRLSQEEMLYEKKKNQSDGD